MTRVASLLYLVLAVAAVQVPLVTQPKGSVRLPNFGQYLDEVAKEFKLPGVSIAVVRTGEKAELYNWGHRSESGSLSSEDTLYSIASNSKAFNAIAVGILIDDFKHGRNVTPLPAGVDLDWTTKVADLLPEEWKLQDEWASSQSNLLDLLSHVTGMPRHDLSYNPTLAVKDLVHNLRYLRPTFEFREKWQYNNMMYGTTSYVIQKYSGQLYTSFVQARIFDALGMQSSTYHPDIAFDSGMVADSWADTTGPYLNETRRIPYFFDDWTDTGIGMNAGAGGVITSTRDLIHWVETLLNDGKHPETGEQVIPSSVLNTVMTGRSVEQGKPKYPELSPVVYGAGWWRFSYAGQELVQHSGSVPGFSSLITLLPHSGIGIISLTNGDLKDSALQSLQYRIIEDSFGLKHVNWPERFLNASLTELETERERSAVSAQRIPSSLSEVPDLSKFLGTYSNPGYVGNFTLCASPATPGSACDDVLQAYAAVDPTFDSESSTTLYAYWPRLWCTYFKARYQGNATFDLFLDSIFPHGEGKDKTPFIFRRDAPPGQESVIEFGSEGGTITGLGMWGLEGGPRVRIPGSPKDSSEAWFDKVA